MEPTTFIALYAPFTAAILVAVAYLVDQKRPSFSAYKKAFDDNTLYLQQTAWAARRRSFGSLPERIY